jgi:hypothetical protein
MAELALGTTVKLYVASGTPGSKRALANLAAALAALGAAPDSVEIVDVFEMPRRALCDGVIVPPTLIATGTSGSSVLVGDLADAAALRMFLADAGIGGG